MKNWKRRIFKIKKERKKKIKKKMKKKTSGRMNQGKRQLVAERNQRTNVDFMTSSDIVKQS